MNCTLETPEFKTFFSGCEKIYNDYCSLGKCSFRDKFSVTEGQKYIKVIRGSGVHLFVDKTNGDVLKAASLKTPAKHARGNIFDQHNGLSRVTPYGTEYLK